MDIISETEATYRAAIAAGTDNPSIHRNLGLICQKSGRIDEAIDLFRGLVEIYPKDHEAHSLLGKALMEIGDIEAAILSFKEQLQLNPESLEGFLDLANAFTASSDATTAIDLIIYALLSNPESADAYTSLGMAMRAQGSFEEALNCHQQALSLKPQSAQIHLNLGRVQADLNNFDAAKQCFQRSIEIDPDEIIAWSNLGATLHILGDLKGSEHASRRALEIQADYAGARCNLALVELLRGEYKSGLSNYEYRFHPSRKSDLLNACPPCARWNGSDEPLNNHLLLVSEQGLGDTVQFIRYLPTIHHKSWSTSICAPCSLHELIKASGIHNSLITPEAATTWNKGSWMPLLSLPRYLGVTPNNPIENGPYLKVPDDRRQHWEQILSAERKPIIGINWQGNPRQEVTCLKGRSLPLEFFGCLASAHRGSLLSLQKGHGSDQIDGCSFHNSFVNCQEQISQSWDFLDVAAIIANCDLVITSDTCVAHVAGAMGHPTWLLLAKIPDWRWGLEGDTSFWYPSMRLFRQHVNGDWGEVMERVAEALNAYLADRRSET
jgi:Flp pilus assembly protein TadD